MRISDWSSDVCSSDLTVLQGIGAARDAGLKVKINMVALKGLNDRAFLPMLRWCDAQGHDLTLIETMPLGMIDENRTDRYLPLAEALDQISAEHKVTPLAYRPGGPARYFEGEGDRTSNGQGKRVSEGVDLG